MKLIATLCSPLKVHTTISQTTKGGFILNINNYRNTFQMKLNKAKVIYKELMEPQIAKLPAMNKVAVRFILYPRTRRKTDTPNVCCVHDKFFMDALVSMGKLPDDTSDYYVETGYKFGHVDVSNPRVDIEIYEV